MHKSLRNRDIYLRQLKAFQDTEMIKVITGIRRCGKSCLMKLMVEHLRGSGIGDKQIVEMNFESMRFAVMTAKDLYRYVSERVIPGKRMYLFFDEVQRLDGWENAVNSFRVDFDCDIYITGSNAHLLSTELSTYLSGQYVEIKVLPLSFREFLDFHGYTITDSLLLRKLMMFLADNIGNSVSATSIGNTLVSEGLLTEGNRKVKPATHTIQAYFEALKDSYISYEIKRFDIKGKESLKTLGKYYVVDTGLRNYLLRQPVFPFAAGTVTGVKKILISDEIHDMIKS